MTPNRSVELFETQFKKQVAGDGADVLAIDASAAAVERVRHAAGAGQLRIEGVLADLGTYEIPGSFDPIVAIGLLMFFERERALALLGAIQEHVAAGGNAIVNVLTEGTTYLGMFEPASYYLFRRDELRERFEGWDVLESLEHSFEAPQGTTQQFSTLIAKRGALPC